MKIALVISMLGAGGAERVLATMANSLVERHTVTVFTFCSDSTQVFYNFDQRVKFQYLDLLKESGNPIQAAFENIRRIKILRSCLKFESPDITISFLPESNILTLLASLGKKWPVVITEHTNPHGLKLNPLWERLRSLTYKQASTIVVLNKKIREYFLDKYETRVIIIPNPVILPQSENSNTGNLSPPYILTIGRLVESKKVDDVISSFASVSEKYPEWKLVVIGDGPLNGVLHSLAGRQQCKDRIIFTGLVSSPGSILKQASVFVSASITEAFPMAICEAMASGLPVVVREYDESVRDIIIDGVNGLIITGMDNSKFAEAMENLMNSHEMRRSLGSAAKIEMEKYSLESVMLKWEKLFRELGLNV